MELCPGHGGVSGAELPPNVGGRRIGLPVPSTFLMPGPWVDDAACAEATGVNFFSEAPTEIARAKGVCSKCPVVTECGEFALANGERFGVWGGFSERERTKLRRRRDEDAA